MAYANDGCGPFVPAALNTSYRGLKLMSTATGPVSMTVVSYEVEQTVELSANELWSGELKIISFDSGDESFLKGYIP